MKHGNTLAFLIDLDAQYAMVPQQWINELVMTKLFQSIFHLLTASYFGNNRNHGKLYIENSEFMILKTVRTKLE